MAGLLARLGVRTSRARTPLPLVPRPPAPMARVLNADAASTPARAPKAGTVLLPRRTDYQAFFSGDMTPERVVQILNSTLYGSAHEQNDAFDRMLERDPHVASEYDKRLMALGGLELDIVSASQIREGDLSDEEKAQADEAAAYVRAVLNRIRVEGYGVECPTDLPAGLRHLDDGIGRGLAGLEQEWGTTTITLPATQAGTRKTIQARAPIVWHLIAPRRFRYDAQEPWRLRVMADETDFTGLAIDEQPAGKFLIHAPKPIGGRGMRGALHRRALMCYMAKTSGWKFFLIGMELFGQPYRIGKYAAGATPEEVAAILTMLEDMGVSAAGVFKEGTEIDVVSTGFTSSGTQSIYERCIKICDAAVSKNYIGNALTTEVQGDGANRDQPSMVPEEVRKDIRDDDIIAEGATLTEQFVKPLLRASVYGALDEALWPKARRCVPDPQDDVADMTLMHQGSRLGKKFTAGQLAERFGWPLVGEEKEDTVLEGIQSAGPFGADMGGGDGGDIRLAENRAAIRLVSNSALDKIRSRKTFLARLVPWILTASLASQAHSETVIERFGEVLAPFDDAAVLTAPLIGALADEFGRLPTGDLQELMRQALLAAELAGRAQVANKVRGRRAENAQRVINAESIDFAKLPFVEAIESLRDRIGMDPVAFTRLDAEARSRAWRVAGVWDMNLLAVLHTNLVQSMANGETVRDFRLRVLPQMLDREGWTGENPWHANVVHFQNVAMAATAGRYRQMQDLDIRRFRNVGIGDSCEICAPYDNKVFPITDTKAMGPFHFFCDHEPEPVFEDEAEDETTSTDEIDNPALDAERAREKGFKWNVRDYAGLEPIKLGKYPAEFHVAFQKMAAAEGLPIVEGGSPAPAPAPGVPRSPRASRSWRGW